jgi:hypothetical protein
VKPIDVALCDRGKHILAKLQSDENGLYVLAREPIHHTDGWEPREFRYGFESVRTDEAGAVIGVACACGRQYMLDLVAAFRDRKFGSVVRAQEHSGPVDDKRRNAVRNSE